MLTCFVIILWFLLGLIGAKWCLDDIYDTFKKIDNIDVFLSVVNVLVGPVGFIVGLFIKYNDGLEKAFTPNFKLTERIQNYYQRKQ